MLVGVGDAKLSLCSSNLVLRAASRSGVRKLFSLRLFLLALRVIFRKVSVIGLFKVIPEVAIASISINRVRSRAPC